MTLHLNQELFKDAIEACAQNVGMNALYVEKDYWVSYILKAISQSQYKGATCKFNQAAKPISSKLNFLTF